MIVVIGRVTTSPEQRSELIRLGQEVARASRAESGCLGYRLYEDTETENAFVFVEEWADEDALQRHFATDHIAGFMSAFPATLIAAPDVRFHSVQHSRDLSEVSRR